MYTRVQGLWATACARSRRPGACTGFRGRGIGLFKVRVLVRLTPWLTLTLTLYLALTLTLTLTPYNPNNPNPNLYPITLRYNLNPKHITPNSGVGDDRDVGGGTALTLTEGSGVAKTPPGSSELVSRVHVHI